MDVYERRKMFLELSKPDVSQETVEKYAEKLNEEPIAERYGETEELLKENANGREYKATHRGEIRNYWVPSEGAWINAGGITLNQAYRIFEQDDKTMKIREVKDFSELESITNGMYAELRRLVGE